MFGLLAYHTDEPLAQTVDGVHFCVVYVARGRGLRAKLSAYAAANVLRRKKVRFSLFPPDYPFISLFSKRGISSPPLAPLFRAAAPAIVRRFLTQCGIEPSQAMVAFAAKRIMPELRYCVTTLCSEIRYIALCVSEGGEALAHTLRWERGIAVRIGAPDALPRPNLTVAFDDIPIPGNTLRLDEMLSVTFDSPYSNELLALLHRVNALDIEALAVKSVTQETV